MWCTRQGLFRGEIAGNTYLQKQRMLWNCEPKERGENLVSCHMGPLTHTRGSSELHTFLSQWTPTQEETSLWPSSLLLITRENSREHFLSQSSFPTHSRPKPPSSCPLPVYSNFSVQELILATVFFFLLLLQYFKWWTSLQGFGESRMIKIWTILWRLLSDFSIKRFYFSSLALADDSPPTVFSSQMYSLQRALQLTLRKFFFSLQVHFI